jgi:putative sigma-54 modulation protein
MEIRVTFRHVHPSNGLREYAEKKVARLERFAHVLLDAHVILSVEKQRHCAEIQVSGRNLQVTAIEETTDLYSALDLALDKVERQIKKHDEKRKNRKPLRSNSTRGRLTNVSGQEARTHETVLDGVRLSSERVAVKPMSVDEAALQLEQGGGPFVLFRHDGTDEFAVLYRAKDGSLRLIQAEQA